MKLISAITSDTINRLSPGAGILLKNFDFAEATDAGTLMELVIAASDCWLGATKGGISVSENRSTWTPEFDGKRLPYKGDKLFDTAAPKISGTLVEISPERVQIVSASADMTTSGNVTTIKPRASIDEGDYLDNVVWITNHGSDGIYLVELKNALCTSGLSTQSADKDILTLPFEFVGHSDSPVYSDELPIKYLFFAAAAKE